MSPWHSINKRTLALAVGLGFGLGSWSACTYISRRNARFAAPEASATPAPASSPEPGPSPAPGSASAPGPFSLGNEPEPVIAWPEPGAPGHPAADLWRAARRLYEGGHYADAVIRLQKLFDRYPGYPDAPAYHELRLLLGRSYLELGRNGRAVTYLQSYLEGAAPGGEAQEARVYLGEAYLRMKRYEEAYLLTAELEKAPHTPRIETHAMLLRTRALIGLGEEDQAELAVSAARRLADRLQYLNLMGQAETLSLRLRLRRCVPPAHRPPADEGKAIAQIRRQGDCLNEALADYERSLEIGHPPSSRQSQRLMTDAFQAYALACDRPSPPLRRPPLTARQRAAYVSELALQLGRICDKYLETSLKILRNWEAGSPPPPAWHRATELEREIEGQLKHRNAGSAWKDMP